MPAEIYYCAAGTEKPDELQDRQLKDGNLARTPGYGDGSGDETTVMAISGVISIVSIRFKEASPDLPEGMSMAEVVENIATPKVGEFCVTPFVDKSHKGTFMVVRNTGDPSKQPANN